MIKVPASSAGGSFSGRGLAIVVSAEGLAQALAESLGDMGVRTVRIENIDNLVTREDWQRALAQAANDRGPFDFIIHCLIPCAAGVPASFSTLPANRWHDSCRSPLTSTLHFLQAVSTHFAGSRASVMGLGPSFALTGAPQAVALCAALEGQRAMFKSAARQWGERGITLNWIMAAAESFGSLFADIRPPRRADPVHIAQRRRPDLQTEIIPALMYFASPAARCITGATLCIDGGEWMVP